MRIDRNEERFQNRETSTMRYAKAKSEALPSPIVVIAGAGKYGCLFLENGPPFLDLTKPNPNRTDAKRTLQKGGDKTFVSAEANLKGKEVKTMKYVKPEIAVLARAMAAVQGMTKDVSNVPDSPRVHSVPAYEADE